MENQNIDCEAELFAKELLKQCFMEGNVERLRQMLHPEAIWVKGDSKKVLYCENQVFDLFSEWNSSYKWRRVCNEKYRSFRFSDNYVMVYGSLTYETEKEGNSVPLEEFLTFSMMLIKVDNSYLLRYLQFSEASSSYNLNTIMDNIDGCFKICRMDKSMTLLYSSTGMDRITGYTRKEIFEQFQNCCIKMINQADLTVFERVLSGELEVGEKFSMEYRINAKAGRTVWVMNQGRRLPDDEDGGRIQCIITDITKQKEQEEKLRLSEKRYEVALFSSDLSMFEYNILTKELIFFNGLSQMYQLPDIVQDGPETLVRNGIIEPASVTGYRRMYQQIHSGVKRASCLITTRDAEGVLHDYELTLTTIFDIDNRPVRAIGVRKNVTQMMRLEKEKEFGKTLVANRTFLCEVCITTGKVTDLNKCWASENGLEDKEYKIPELIEWVVENLAAPEHKALVKKKLSAEYLSYKFSRGENLVEFSFRCIPTQGGFVWHEVTVNIIRDERTNHLFARFYDADIQERKEKELKALEEQRVYESMTKKAVLAYEVNITRNSALRGHEKWESLYGIETSSDYYEMIEAFAAKAVYKEDRKQFLQLYKREHILKMFYNGQRQFSCEYRKKGKNGEYKWALCTMNLYEDPETGDVRGFSYVEDIDVRKQAELELKFNAEHDRMTKIYNKVTVQEKITEFLNLEDAKKKQHAFLMIDIDYFKSVNDDYGHVFGDMVICEVANRIRKIFREEDIIGRIGGDEFCVLIKNVPSIELVKAKAEEVCERMRQSFVQDQKICNVSGSVGVAINAETDMTYNELYQIADDALYIVKKRGKNGYHISQGLAE